MSSRKKTSSSVIRKSATEVAQVELLEDRQYRSGNTSVGINVNENSVASFDKAVPILKTLGVTSVRLWAGVSDVNQHTMLDAMQRAIDYHNAGFDVTLTVNLDDKSVPNAAAVKSWFQWAASNKALDAAVSRWEIGNEVDSKTYFDGTLQQYVTNYLAPAYQALHAAGEQVVSAGVSWNPQDIQTLINDGVLNYCDDIGFHPYANGVASQKANIAELETIVDGRKPLVATEWNVRGFENNKTEWAQAVQDAYANVHSAFAEDYYFCLFTQNTPAGPGGLINSGSYTQNTLFYNAFMAATHAYNASLPSTVTSTGNTPSGVAGSISGVLWNDTNGNGVWDTSETDTGSRVVFIDANGNGKLDKGEVSTTSDANGNFKFTGLKAGTYDISRVFPSGYHLSNSSLGYVSVKVASSQQVSGVDLGTTNVAAKTSAPVTTTVSSGSSSNKTASPVVTAPQGPEVTSLSIVDATTGQILSGFGDITASETISLASLPTRNIAVIANLADAASVKVSSNASTAHIENTLPYAFFGDDNGKYNTWHVSAGSYQFTAVAYANKNGLGTQGNTMSVQLKFI